MKEFEHIRCPLCGKLSRSSNFGRGQYGSHSLCSKIAVCGGRAGIHWKLGRGVSESERMELASTLMILMESCYKELYLYSKYGDSKDNFRSLEKDFVDLRTKIKSSEITSLSRFELMERLEDKEKLENKEKILLWQRSENLEKTEPLTLLRPKVVNL
jgi:hypothetical protein